MKRGEDWALPAKDKGPVRALARDYVDSRRGIGEYFMYIVFAMLILLFIRSKSTANLLTPILFTVLLVLAADGYLVRRRLSRLVAERLPGESTRGLTAYAVMRSMQIRRLRMPQPRVKPGDKI
jgi:hypothetical protein